MEPWPIQVRGVEGVMDAIAQGFKVIALTSPTGTGKTWMVGQIARRFLDVGKRAVYYVGKRVLLDQVRRDMDEQGFSFGVRAAGHYAERHHALQIASLPTERTRSKKESHEKCKADVVLVEEGHLHCQGREDRRVLQAHVDDGAVVILVTATPIGVGHFAQKIVQAGVVSDGFECGALVRAVHYGPDEPALDSMKHSLAENVSETDSRRAVMRKGIFGRVLEWWRKLNPEGKPTILFAPGVPESKWFAQEFFKAGVPSAHIDGEEVWINGETLESTQGARDEIAKASRCGDVAVVCNRFVLREGVNWPWLGHGIFATVFDSLASYLQAGGRLLRNYPGLHSVVVQDHGGNWRRHGSLNEDRYWSLDDTQRLLANRREDGYRDPNAPQELREPLTCPRCAAVVRPQKFMTCHACGFEFPISRRVRSVVQVDGTLVKITGKMFPAREVRLEEDTVKKWKAIYWAYKNARKRFTFRAAYGYFMNQHGYYPPKDLPYMPLKDFDWDRPVRGVHPERLIPDPNKGSRKGTEKPKGPALFDT